MEAMAAGEIVHRTIPYEGERIDRPRDQRRVVLEVTTESTNGCDVEGHYVPACAVVDGVVVPRTATIEVYVDRVPAVLRQVRGPRALMALEQARELAKAARQAWLEEEIADPKARERMRNQPATDGRSANQLEWLMRWRCPVNEYTELYERFPEFRSGLPPLTSVSVVDPKTGRVVADLTALAGTDVPFDLTLDAPPTPATAAKHANEHLAATMADAIARASSGGSDQRLARLEQLLEAQTQTIAAQAAQIAELKAGKGGKGGRAE